ncbi:MAG TPA: orotate phosphoribosyltransferase [Porphyromonadaceae bacterium]|nr:orotate phosphoribosyltransferase [Porphyromonadaceae bacterium]
MENIETIIARELLDIHAITLRPNEPFTWASGWKSPIYCDNRKTLSFVKTRNLVKESFVHLLKDRIEGIDVIAGVATGAIPQGALVADYFKLPFVYVRSTPKDHGMCNLVEGEVKEGERVVVIEDLISTGKSSLNAVKALREKGCIVEDMFAVFTYGFSVASDAFSKEGVNLTTLTNYNAVLEESLRRKEITEEQIQTLREWRKDPANWRK